MAFCRVSYIDLEQVRHEVQVEADTLYEAVAKAVHHFRAGLWHGNPPGSSCEFNVQIWREHPISYKVPLAKVEHHARHGTAKGPKDILFRQKLRDLLGITDERIG